METVIGMVVAFILGALVRDPSILDRKPRPIINIVPEVPKEPKSEAEEKEEREYLRQYRNMMNFDGKPQGVDDGN